MNAPTTRAGARTPPAPAAWPLHHGDTEAIEAQAMATVALRSQRDRHSIALEAAQDAGYWHGHRVGYLQGWSWGAICGAVAGVMLTVALILGAIWVRGSAPTAEQLQQLLATYPGEGQS